MLKCLGSSSHSVSGSSTPPHPPSILTDVQNWVDVCPKGRQALSSADAGSMLWSFSRDKSGDKFIQIALFFPSWNNNNKNNQLKQLQKCWPDSHLQDIFLTVWCSNFILLKHLVWKSCSGGLLVGQNVVVELVKIFHGSLWHYLTYLELYEIWF